MGWRVSTSQPFGTPTNFAVVEIGPNSGEVKPAPMRLRSLILALAPVRKMWSAVALVRLLRAAEDEEMNKDKQNQRTTLFI